MSEIGRVVAQDGPEVFRFASQVDADGEIVVPGDYVQLDVAGETVAAIVQRLVGRLEKPTGVPTRRYEYDCAVVSGQTRAPLVGTRVSNATGATLRGLFENVPSKPITIGELAHRSNEHIPVVLDGAGLVGAHTCIFGASGFGKSTLLGLLLEEVLLNIEGASVVILDPNSDFVGWEKRTIDQVNEAWNACAAVSDDDLREDQQRLSRVSPLLKRGPTLSVDRFSSWELLERYSPPPLSAEMEILLRFLSADLKRKSMIVTPEAFLGPLKAIALGSSSELVARTRDLIRSEELRNRAVIGLTSAMARLRMSPLWATSTGDALSAIADAPQVLGFDLGQLPFEDRAILAEKILAELWKRNESSRQMTFVAIDEAHHVAPASAEHGWQRGTLDWINRIAGEGRKYGLYLILASQRPAKVHANTLDNCSNHFVMRIQNQDDLESLVRGTSAISHDLMARASTFRHLEGLVFGRRWPTAVVRTGRRRFRTNA